MKPPSADDLLEELLAAALAAFDEHGEAGLRQFLDQHAAHRPALERGLARCRQMGLLGAGPALRDFPERLGEFRLLRRLGSGGMGVVYEAEQESLGRRVAIKVVRPELLYFEGARERFRREIEAIARLSHPAIVPVLASGEQDGLPWYAMDLLQGSTVHEVCAALHGRDPATLRGEDLRQAIGAQPGTATDPFAGAWWQTCTRILHAVALGVRHAHLRGIVHRDIKPSNVMLTRDGRTLLLDFGIARLTGGGDFTRTGNTPGSPAFMSPEQLRGDAVDERTDVYSLGATLWQLLTLEPPFAGRDALQRLRDGDAPRLRSRNREVPPELELVVRTAMDGDRERRYPDVASFADDLLAVLNRRTIRARRLGLPLRGWRWCQRHRVTATALACLLVAAFAVPVVLAWRERAVNRELQAAVARADEGFATSLDAIDRMLVTMANERLRFVPEAEAATIEALQHACTMYDALLAKDPSHARLRHDAGLARNRLAATLVRTGQPQQAIDTYQQVVRLLETPGVERDAELLEVRACAHLNLGALHKEFGEAVRDQALADRLRAALAAAERDFTALGQMPHRRGSSANGLAQAAALRAELPEVARDPAALQATLERAVDLAREAVAVQPAAIDLQIGLVRNLDNLATHCYERRADAAAEPLLEEALAVARRMPRDARIWPPRDVLESDVLETLGNLYQRRGDERTRSTLAACVDLREPMARRHPDDIDLLSRLGGALHNLARTWCGDAATPDDLEQALLLLDRAIPLQRQVLAKSPGFERARLFLHRHLRLRGNTLARLQRRVELEAVAEELAGDVHNADHQRAVARFWLRAAAMHDAEPGAAAAPERDYLALATTALLAAERAGWHSRSRLDEPVYAPLASLPEFAALRARLAERAAAASAAAPPHDRVSPPSTSSANREMPR
ncbi:MAG: serine/threonine protein kinase [Planctomycetes bacterium]|nr:serine/threonine protein kinase [Planctomycetota bacterium]